MIARLFTKVIEQRAYVMGWWAWTTHDPRHHYANRPLQRAAFDAGVLDAIRFGTHFDET